MAVAVSLRFLQSSYPSSQSSPWYYISNYINCRRFVFHRHLRYYRILSLISIAFALASDRSHYLCYYVFEIYFSMILISIFIYLKGTLISAFSLILQYACGSVSMSIRFLQHSHSAIGSVWLISMFARILIINIIFIMNLIAGALCAF